MQNSFCFPPSIQYICYPTSYIIIGLEKIGMLEFFGLLFILYEAISILKNMYLIGIPMPLWLKDKLEKLLTQLTNEVPTKLLENEESFNALNTPKNVSDMIHHTTIKITTLELKAPYKEKY